MAIVLGLVGEKGSGKETFGNFFEEVAEGKTVHRVRFSDVLLQTLTLWSIPPTRENLQKIAVVMKDGFGPDTLTHAVEEIIKGANADFILLDGVRWLPDAELIKKFPRNKQSFSTSKMVYLTAKPELRFERLKKRKLSYRENETKSYSQFLKEEKAENELYIPLIGAQADFKIENNGTLDDLKEAVKELYGKLTP